MAKRKQPSRSFSVRFSTGMLQKLGWYAAERGVNHAEAVRIAVHDAVKDAKPPSSDVPGQIQADPVRWAAWSALADALGVSMDDMFARTFDPMVRKTFGTAPKMRNGKLHWKNPADGDKTA